jgi:hypothetical protein
MVPMDKAERWFNEGSITLRRTLQAMGQGHRLPSIGDYYACPCCLKIFDREAVTQNILTIEHVPPVSVVIIILVLNLILKRYIKQRYRIFSLDKHPADLCQQSCMPIISHCEA